MIRRVRDWWRSFWCEPLTWNEDDETSGLPTSEWNRPR